MIVLMSTATKKVLTLVIIHTSVAVLLGYKKRGFGMGRWNGFGGKVEAGESIEDAATRECVEEAGVTPIALASCGVLTFVFDGDPVLLEVHLFRASQFRGEPRESDEMRPQWFPLADIPYATMWPDDRYWLPYVLEGKTVDGTFSFSDPQTIRTHTLSWT